MTFNPKVAGGAAAVAAIGGGGGYIASKSISGSSEENKVTLKTIKDSSATETIAKAIKDASFELLTEEEKYSSEWDKLISKNSDYTKETLQNRCKELLNERYQPNNKYQEAIKKCTKLQTLKERAEAWGLTPLNTTATPTTGETNSDDTHWTTKSASGSGKNAIDTNSNKNKETLKTSCIKASTKTHFDNDFNSTLWENYLKGCIKEGTTPATTYTNSLTFSYWTKSAKVTVENKLTASGFSKQDNYSGDSNDCTTKIKEEYNTETYKGIAVKCSKNKTFHAKATTGLTLTLEVEGSYEAKWKKADRKEAIKKLVTSITSDTLDETNKSAIKTACEATTPTITTSTNQEEWRNYLLACIKEDTGTETKLAEALKKDFWTGDFLEDNK